MLTDLRVIVRDRVAQHPRIALPLEGRGHAAVALVLHDHEQSAGQEARGEQASSVQLEPALVLTRRRQDLRRHPGQFALPGGRLDPGETVEQAVRRELAEEVGLRVGPEAVLGLLDDFPTRSGFVITPVVLWAVGAGPLAPEPAEVQSVHPISLAELRDDAILHLDPLAGSEHPVLSLGIVGTRVFAPTGALLWQFREVALFGRPTRVGHYEQPPWAWR